MGGCDVEKWARKVDRPRILYTALSAVFGLLILLIIYQAANQTLNPAVSITSRQEVLSVGEDIAANFKIINPNPEPRLFTYAVYINDEKSYENSVTINPKRNFVFGGHYRAVEPGEVKVTALVYEGDKERLVENISYFVTVKQK